jgi:hypothetical protein
MSNIVPIRPGIQVRPAGQVAVSTGPSPWMILGIAAVSIVAYEGVKYWWGTQKRAYR